MVTAIITIDTIHAEPGGYSNDHASGMAVDNGDGVSVDESRASDGSTDIDGADKIARSTRDGRKRLLGETVQRDGAGVNVPCERCYQWRC